MAHVLVRITVGDQTKWKAGFTEAGELRKRFGSKGVNAFAKVGSPNEILILGEYEDLEKAKQLFQSQEFRDAAAKAGVTGPPDVTPLDHLLDLPA